MAPWRILRWGARVVASPLLGHLLPRWTVIALIAVQLDVIVDWGALAVGLQDLPPEAAAAVFFGLSLLWAQGESAFVADTLLGPRLGILRRQPVPGWAFGPGAAALLGVLALPLGAVALAWYTPARPAGGMLWVALAAPTMLAWAARRPLAAVAAAAVGAMGIAVVQAQPGWTATVAVAAWLVVVPLSGAGFAGLALAGNRAPRSPPGRPRTVVAAYVHRDLLALWRCDRSVVWQALGVAPVVGGIVRACRDHGFGTDRALTRVTLIALALLGPTVLVALAAVARRLGPQLDPPRWPTRPGQRGAALGIVGCAMLCPSWAAAAVGGAPILGPGGHLQVLGFVGAIAAGAAAFVAHRPRRTNHGLFLWWIGGCLGGSLGIPGGAWLFGGAAAWFTVRRLQRRRSR